ncbi:MAG: acyl-CoA dehydrogenase family protein [Myxococcales bacterium]|nr:acyl-CoA dehydrogenase family protein [Myxococcales bacterium]MCB9530504.1 acyl-CoA dehydrogenase family protein [Myxococcales bacterium]MCB9533456.1 acyl-CoA dehydrogenase family protein [Myxococcales bacterium]
MTTKPRGCSFLLNPVGTETIFTPEAFTEEQRMFAKTAEEFMEREVLPVANRLEEQEPGLMVSLLKKAGEIGLLMIDVPEEYGGLALDKTTSMLCGEKLAAYGGFSVSHGAHVGIGSLPLIFFGNADQKAKYLPRLATGELLAAYALTEPGSGSDALGAKTSAVLETDAEGRRWYRLNGTKMWITNAGFADLFTVFAKVDGDKFTAFLVEAAFSGVSTGAEEHKMGIKGSSTRMLILEDVLVPEENVLGEIGRGHKIAFNILNFGRFKLGVGVLGAAKRTIGIATRYALDRKQFKQPIASFGAIRQKLADMTIQTYALEAMCYRVAGYMDTAIDALDSSADGYSARVMDAIEEFAVEDSIMKVFGSEAVSFVIDEAVQIHGGYGYSREYEVERAYRDARINRIFEGTNEVNRMLIPGLILKSTMKGDLPLFEVIARAEAAIAADKPQAPSPREGALDHELFLCNRGKLLTVFIANASIQRFMATFKDEQEVMLAIADMMILTYGVDSTLSRVKQLAEAGQATPVHFAIAAAFAAQSYEEIVRQARRLAPSLAKGDDLVELHAKIDKLVFPTQTDLIAAKRVVAAHTVEHPDWNL